MAVELSQSTTHEALMRLSIKQLLRILADRGIKNSDCEKRDVAHQVLEIAHSNTVAVSRRDLLVRLTYTLFCIFEIVCFLLRPGCISALFGFRPSCTMIHV
jgi:hypothetical protein